MSIFCEILILKMIKTGNPRCLGAKVGQYAVILLYNLCFIPFGRWHSTRRVCPGLESRHNVNSTLQQSLANTYT